jgi:hypothetical protein
MEGLWKGPAFASPLLKHYLSTGKEGLSKTTKFASRVIDVPTQSPTEHLSYCEGQLLRLLG